MREYFMETERTGFLKWEETDIELAKLLWGSPEVTHYICTSGRFTPQEIEMRLQTEIKNNASYGVQYWPVFERESQELIGCCGLRPFEKEENAFEIGFHLREKYWGQGFAKETAKAVIEYAFSTIRAKKLVAGHHPENHASGKLLGKLGFSYIGDNYYEPTGFMHPSYALRNEGESL